MSEKRLDAKNRWRNVVVEMLVKMRFGIGAEEDDSSAQY